MDDTKQIEVPLNVLNRDGVKALVAGLILGSIFVLLKPLNFTLSYLVTLVHEMGHTLFYWLFGYPSIPSFDFTYGGGVTHFFSRNGLLMTAMIVLFLAVFFWAHRHRGFFVFWIVVVCIYGFLTFTQWHECVTLAMGHGTELLFAVLCFYRMFSARGLIHEVERPLYGLIGFFIWFKDMGFAFSLMFSPGFRAEYGDAKGGGHWMDFSQIADAYLNVSIQVVAFLFLLACVAVPVVAFFLFKYRNRILERASLVWDTVS